MPVPDLLMLAPSLSWRPELLVSDARSLPARSTSDSLPVYTYRAGWTCEVDHQKGYPHHATCFAKQAEILVPSEHLHG